MKVFIAATTIRPSLEARNWGDHIGLDVFLELETWAKRVEASWGECYVFIEVSLPSPRTPLRCRNQVDMLICFDRRLALCEVKSHSAARFDVVSRAKEQIEAQSEWLGSLLREARYFLPKEALRKYLLLPRLGPAQVQAVHKLLIDQFSAPHIKAVGPDPGAGYFVDSLSRGGWSETSLPPGGPGIQRFLFQAITAGGPAPKCFDGFSQARAYLSTIRPTSRHLPDEWYIEGLRPEELNGGERILRDRGIVELVGSPGIGKSTVAMELCERLGLEVFKVPFLTASSTAGICRVIHDAFYGDSLSTLTEEQIVHALVREPMLFWLPGYASGSAAAVDQFLQLVQRHSRAGDDSAPRGGWSSRSLRGRASLHKGRSWVPWRTG